MTAQVDFFCTADEEREILAHVTRSADVVPFFPVPSAPDRLPVADLDRLPPWPEPLVLCFWLRSAGELRWHTERPKLPPGGSHRSLVLSVFAREDWDRIQPKRDRALIDGDRSPIVCFRRAAVRAGKIGPSLLIAPAGNLARVSPDFKRWVGRCFAWMKRRATKVHDWKQPSGTITNPDRLLSTIYAFPRAHEALDRYAIFVS